MLGIEGCCSLVGRVLDWSIKVCGLNGLVVQLVECWTEVSKVVS